MKKYNNFNDFGNHVKVEKEKKVKEALIRLNQGVFVENLSHLNKEQIEFIVPVDKIEHIDYLFENKKDILLKECVIEKSVNWIQSWDTFGLIYAITIPKTGETIELRTASNIDSNGIPVDIEFDIEAIYLKESFLKKHTINIYTEEDYQLIELYNKLFNTKTPITYNTKHAIKQKNTISVSDNFQYLVSYELLARKQINAGMSRHFMKISDTSSNSFAEKLRNLLETEYTLPMVAKKINELTEDDITVIQMGLI
jgi:hypothetical protein